jgi:hypothetical protein
MTFTVEAQSIWDQVPEATRAKLLDSGFCAHCLTTRHFDLLEGEVRGKDLALIGKCGTCGHRVVRLIEI